ncbi:MAG: hypothetical protein PHE78_08250 [Candidatus Gastranaerophilales bacterium]|nr:hypothetical protein [Candidatus Gastranaerophilales bacterium]
MPVPFGGLTNYFKSMSADDYQKFIASNQNDGNDKNDIWTKFANVARNEKATEADKTNIYQELDSALNDENNYSKMGVDFTNSQSKQVRLRVNDQDNDNKADVTIQELGEPQTNGNTTTVGIANTKNFFGNGQTSETDRLGNPVNKDQKTEQKNNSDAIDKILAPQNGKEMLGTYTNSTNDEEQATQKKKGEAIDLSKDDYKMLDDLGVVVVKNDKQGNPQDLDLNKEKLQGLKPEQLEKLTPEQKDLVGKVQNVSKGLRPDGTDADAAPEVKKEEKKENQPQVEYYDKDKTQKRSEVKQNEDGTTSKVRYSKNGDVVSESITNGNKKIADIKHNKDGSTQRTEYDENNRKKSITEKNKDGNVTKTTEFTKDGSIETSKNKAGQEVVRTYDKDGTITGVTIGGEQAKGTAQTNGDEDVEDATFVDAEKAAALLKNDDKLKAAVKGLEIKDGDKELTPDQINKAIQSGDLEVYQNEDGEYIVKSKVEDKKDKDGNVIEGEKSEKLGVGAKKDPYQKMMESFMGDGSDPMKMMMGFMMMQMMMQMTGGGMMGQNPMAAMNQFGAMSGQRQKPEKETAAQAFADRGIESWFDGSRNSKARMLANKDSASEKAELLRAKADYRRENGQPNWFQRNFLFKKTSDQLDAKAEKQEDKVAAIEATLA